MHVRAGIFGMVFGIAILTVSAEEPKRELVEYESTDGKYKILLPGEVTTKNKTQKAGGGSTITVFAEMDLVYMVSYHDLPKPLAPKQAKEKFKEMVDSFKKNGTKVTHEKSLTVGSNKLTALEIRGEHEKVRGKYSRVRYIISGERIYTILAGGATEENVTSKFTDKVFDSFKITK